MSEMLGFLVAICISVIISTAVLLAMFRPLQAMLAQLCGEAKGTQFWLAFTTVTLYIAPLLVTLVGFDPTDQYTLLTIVRRAAIGALMAALAALFVMALKIARFIPPPGALASAPAPRDPNEFWGDRAAK